MAAQFTTVNLSQLPVPNLIQQISFDDIVAAQLADLVARDPTYTATVESDPAYKILEVTAYRETLVRQAANNYAMGLMLAFAEGPQLDQLGANVNVGRLTLTPADNTTVPPTPAVMEEDDDYRARIQLSFEGYTTAGSQGSYEYHAFSADARVADCWATSPSPGVVNVYVLSNVGDGTATPDLLAAVNAALSAEDVRPLTDQVNVLSAEIVDYEIDAVLTVYPGPDPDVILAAAQTGAQTYVNSVRKLGYTVSAAGIDGSMFVAGVADIARSNPSATLSLQPQQAGYCTAINITVNQQASD